ncbi:MAG: GTP pyrophosphokinase family protein [Clostridia bacterium]|nr:GTP pyrophosphokinase family protein [Clostridia bacterium]MBQ2948553.1 GTP pyrophosphokinase family protein [Clostridia bacterium]MBQ4608153.1 GTP pyrophosphokinase family protein [Clostridia bacterium]MBQ6859313.1 GTP pyrophosphokinase family protein [Clostridia bacterium]MBQ7051221.1 GTP pyrophosphokinase family protein [Clostridia bacterium]
MRNNELRGATAIELDIIPSDTEHLFTHEALYQETMLRYHCAILEMRTKLEVLSKDLAVRYRRNPIEFIESRLKKPSSIARKLRRNGAEITVENMIEQVSDIAGIRVLCAYIDDIYEIARMLARQQDVKIINVKDYIKNPKDNGYRSYHMIVEIPVYFSDQVRPVRCEIQIRTIAMDFWATLDHDMQYKKEVRDAEEIMRELRECADIIHNTDEKMMRLRERIHRIE